jgi:8-oxo-dGTP pyrophosphatase MutT (NUDIX family)
MASRHRDISLAILIDSQGRFLFQQRDDVPGIVAQGKIGHFGGHREGNETFLECVVREVQEETTHKVATRQPAARDARADRTASVGAVTS